MSSSLNQVDAIPNPKSDKNQLPLRPKTVGFYIASVLFNLCLTAQLITVGLAHFYNPFWWTMHVWLVRGYSGLSLILLAWAYWVSFPKPIRILAVSLPCLLGLQFLTIHFQTPLPFPLAIFHPLIGFVLFYVSATLVHRIWRLLSPRSDKSNF